MTVQELFNSLTFDDIMAALRWVHRNDRSIQNVAAAIQGDFKSLNIPTKINFFKGTDTDAASALNVQFVCISETVIPDDDED